MRSDEQLVALFRAGSDDAFRAIHDRYRQRLFAYVRQMLGGSRPDAEDTLQDVFIRAHQSLRGSDRPVLLRAWLYRVAHNRCIDHLRRPVPPPGDVFELSRRPLHDPLEEAERREGLRNLVLDVGRLPPQQRSALLMREMQGLSLEECSGALDVSVAAVKSLLVRARLGLVEAEHARMADCRLIREELALCCDRGVRISGLARRHLRDCGPCRQYRDSLKAHRRAFAALAPPSLLGPLGLAAKSLGLTGTGGAGTGMGMAGGGLTATKVAAVVCCAAAVTGGALQGSHPVLSLLPVPQHHAAAPRLPLPHRVSAAAAAPEALVPAALPAGAVDGRRSAGLPLAGAGARRAHRTSGTPRFLTGQDSYPADPVAPPTLLAAGPSGSSPPTTAAGPSSAASGSGSASLLSGVTSALGGGSQSGGSAQSSAQQGSSSSSSSSSTGSGSTASGTSTSSSATSTGSPQTSAASSSSGSGSGTASSPPPSSGPSGGQPQPSS